MTGDTQNGGIGPQKARPKAGNFSERQLARMPWFKNHLIVRLAQASVLPAAPPFHTFAPSDSRMNIAVSGPNAPGIARFGYPNLWLEESRSCGASDSLDTRALLLSRAPHISTNKTISTWAIGKLDCANVYPGPSATLRHTLTQRTSSNFC